MGPVPLLIELGRIWDDNRVTPLAAAQFTVSRVYSSPDLEFLPRANFKKDLCTFNCLTGRVLLLLMGLHCQRPTKGGVPEQQHFSQYPAMHSTFPKAPLQHPHFISHIQGQAGGSATLAEGTVKCCCSPGPTTQTHLYWDRGGTCKMHHPELQLCNLFLLAYLGIKTLPSRSRIPPTDEDN